MITQDAVIFLNTVCPDGQTDWFQYSTGYKAELTFIDDTILTSTNFTTTKESVNYTNRNKVTQVVKRVFSFGTSSTGREIKKVRILVDGSFVVAEYVYSDEAQLINNPVIVNGNEGLKLEHCLVRYVRSGSVTMYQENGVSISLGPLDQNGKAPFANGFLAQNKALVYVDDNSGAVVVNVKTELTSTRLTATTFENEFTVIMNLPDSFVAPFDLPQIKKLVVGSDNVIDPGTVTWEFDTPIIKDPTKSLILSCKYQEIVEIHD